MSFDVDVRGVPELVAALERVKGKLDPAIGKTLSAAAEPVKSDVKRRASGYSAKTVSGVRTRRKGVMIRVEQSQRKTTGFHPTYGAFQQRNFFDPALDDNKDEVIDRLFKAMDELAESVD